ncbi:adenylate/guanylate cyclase domain-containing protein [Marinibaculum pumilum]|uniref:Adenylate/guanylate cyclase domain-containing protein n=1 Tax=Marinibaculum pumilum TaxID=1766165 RepID=A0ABV7L8T4_9PROT
MARPANPGRDTPVSAAAEAAPQPARRQTPGGPLREAEIAAERIVGIVRMAAAALLAAALMVAVSGAGPDTGDSLEPVFHRQYAVALATQAAYFLLGAAAVAVARPAMFRPWIPWASSALDVAFVLSALWFSLANTGLSTNYIAAMPAAWLLPLILCLGAQRFNTSLQLAVTAALAIGLAVVPALAGGWRIFAEGDGLVDLFFALPPNIMRWVMLVAAGLTIALAVARTHRLLDRMLEEARRRAALTRYLPAELAPWLAAGDGAGLHLSQRRTVAILFVDIRGFTARAEQLSPERLSAFVTDYRRRVQAAARAHDAIIDKFIGDAAMLLFGATGPADRPVAASARDALACGHALLDTIADWNRDLAQRGEPPVAVGVGVHAGTVYCGTVGDAERLEFTVLGDAVNVAARLEAMCKPLQKPMLASAEVLEAAGASAADGWQDLGRQAISGRSEAMRLYAPAAGIAG